MNAGKQYQEGGTQIEFSGTYNPYDATGRNTKWMEYLENTSTINDGKNEAFIELLK